MQNKQKEPEDNPLLDILDLCDVASTYFENSKIQTSNHSVNERDRSPTIRIRQQYIPIQSSMPRKLTILSSNILNYNYSRVKPDCIECVVEKRKLENLSNSQPVKEQLPFHPNYHPIIPCLLPVNHLIVNSSLNINLKTNLQQEIQGSPIPLQSTSAQSINPLYQNNLLTQSIPFLSSQQFRPKELNKDHPLVQLLIKYSNNNVSIQCQKCNNMTFVGYLFKIVNEKDNTDELICFNCCLDPNIIIPANINRLKPYITIDNNFNDNYKVNLINCFYCRNGYHPICYIRYLSNHYTLSQICLLCNLKYRRYNSNKQPQKTQQKPLLVLLGKNSPQSQLFTLSQQQSKDMKDETVKEESMKEKDDEEIKENMKKQITQSERILDKSYDINDEQKQQIVMNEEELTKLKEERLKKKSQILKNKRCTKRKK